MGLTSPPGKCLSPRPRAPQLPPVLTPSYLQWLLSYHSTSRLEMHLAVACIMQRAQSTGCDTRGLTAGLTFAPKFSSVPRGLQMGCTQGCLPEPLFCRSPNFPAARFHRRRKTSPAGPMWGRGAVSWDKRPPCGVTPKAVSLWPFLVQGADLAPTAS